MLGALADHGGALSVAALEPAVRIKRTSLELLLKVLAVDGGWSSTKFLSKRGLNSEWSDPPDPA